MSAIIQNCHPERSTSPAERVTCGVEGSLLPQLKLGTKLVSALKLGTATLREIFDESAYERFLARRKLATSAAAYAQFCRDREHTVMRRPRCC